MSLHPPPCWQGWERAVREAGSLRSLQRVNSPGSSLPRTSVSFQSTGNSSQGVPKRTLAEGSTRPSLTTPAWEGHTALGVSLEARSWDKKPSVLATARLWLPAQRNHCRGPGSIPDGGKWAVNTPQNRSRPSAQPKIQNEPHAAAIQQSLAFCKVCA